MTRWHDAVHTAQAVRAALDDGGIAGMVIQGVDLVALDDGLARADVRQAVFVGCRLTPARIADLIARGAVVFPPLPDLPYDPYRASPYTPDELYDGFDPSDPDTYADTLDARILAHYRATGRSHPPLVEDLARRLHDVSVMDALRDVLDLYGTRPVAIMGGHALDRTAPAYRDVVLLARSLARRGHLVVSGGGPGAMEATHLGATLANAPDAVLDEAIAHLAPAPRYDHPRWLATAMTLRADLLGRFRPKESLAIPTWLYGHEPPTPFATHVAKLFSNAVREEGLVSVARHGIVFAPGSAGTVQEVFQDATQNHYVTLGEMSPMVFLGTRFWTETVPVLSVLRALGGQRPWLDLVAVTDDVDEAVRFLEAHPPVKPGA